MTGKDDQSPLAVYFEQCHKLSLRGIKCAALYQLTLSERRDHTDKVLLQKETRLIFLPNTMSPMGLNNKLLLQPFL